MIPLAQGVEPAQVGCNVFGAFQGEDSIRFTTNDKGIYLFSPSIGTMDHLVAPVDIPVNETTCGIIALGRIWLGTDEGLYYSDADDMVWTEVDENNLPSPKINCMAVDEGSLWVGTPKGAVKLDSGSWRTYTKSDGMGDDWVMDIEVQGEQVWFGTLRGGYQGTHHQRIPGNHEVRVKA